MTLSQIAIERAGLSDLVASHARGAVPPAADLARALDTDLLALGSAADAVRAAGVGDDVRIHLKAPPSSADLIVISTDDVPATERDVATKLLRYLAMRRLSAPSSTRICLDFGAFGLEIAQVALSFGVTDLTGPIRAPRSLPMAEPTSKTAIKQAEIAGYVTRAKRAPVFVGG